MISLMILVSLLTQGEGFANTQESSAYARILAERNPQSRIKLLHNFEKSYSQSSRLAEVYIELSRMYVIHGDLATAVRYAERSVAAAAKLKSDPPPAPYGAGSAQDWYNWAASVDASAKSNLAWVKHMIAWQQEGLRSTLVRKR